MSISWQRNGEGLSMRRRTDGPPPLRQFTGQLEQLSADDRRFFLDHYEIPQDVAVRNIRVSPETGRYALPIWGPANAERGIVLRTPWVGAPRVAEGFRLPKADTYKANAEPLQSHYFVDPRDGYPQLVLVEDQLSAIKLSAYGVDSVALLGVPDVRYNGYSGTDRVMEIARRAKGREVLVALDADATELAFLFARKWGHAFQSIRVVMLTRDLKDTSARDFREVLGV